MAVVVSNLDTFTVGDSTDLSAPTALSALILGDFTATGTATMASLTQTAGSDDISISLAERYAALGSTYHNLDFKDSDMILPMDVYIDDLNVVDLSTDPDYLAYGLYWKGVPTPGEANDALGYLWQYVYRGRLYSYMTDSPTYFTDIGAAVAATSTVNADVVLTAQIVGKGGNAVFYSQDSTGASPPTVTISESGQSLTISVVGSSGSDDTSDVVSAVNTALQAYVLQSGSTADTLVVASGGSGTGMATEPQQTIGTDTAGIGPAVLTPTELTGDSIPAAVAAKFAAGADAELREVNFAHQLASFCHVASTNWKAIFGAISTKAPTAFDRSTVADWVGSSPTLTDNGQSKFIDAAADNGTGILGIKLLAGESGAAGYRAARVTDGDASDSLAYGGIILTKGAALPNGTDWPYGISDADEAEDANNAPVDIGRHVLVSYDWPIHSNSYNGGTRYRGGIAGSILALLTTLPENVEPIGDAGRIARVLAAPRIHATQQDELAEHRLIGLRRVEGSGLFILSAKTAAHPDSDYSRISTIRSVYKHLEDIRAIAKPYIGKAFSSQSLVSLQSAIDIYLAEQRRLGFNQGARATMSYTRSDKIMGKLTVRLKMVPPFSIEAITVETTLAADESELN